jgi:hypothetical protein
MTDDARAQAEQRLAIRIYNRWMLFGRTPESVADWCAKLAAEEIALMAVAVLNRDAWNHGWPLLNERGQEAMRKAIPWHLVCADAEKVEK